MGDIRYERPYRQVADAPDRAAALKSLSDAEVIEALAAASQGRDAYLANVLASEALNRLHRKDTRLKAAEAAPRPMAAPHAAHGAARVSGTPNGTILEWSPEAERLFGYPASEMVGQDVTGLVPDDRLEEFYDAAMRAARGEPLETVSTERLRKDGSRVAVLRSVQLEPGPDGSVDCVSASYQDLTPSEATPAPVFAASEERYRLMVGSVKDYAIFMLDREGRVATWNEGARRLKGYDPEEIIGYHFSRFYTPEDRGRAHPAAVLAQAIRDGRYEEEGWRVRKDGTLFWADVVITPLFDEQGQHWGFAKVTRDLTERKRSEEALRESEHRFRLLVTSTLDYAIFMLDPAGCIQSWNEGARRLKGYEAHEIIGHHFSRFYTPEDLATDHPAEELAQAIRDGHYEEEGWRIRKDGTRFWANVVITALWDEAGRHIGFSKVTRDLTERKRSEEEVRDLNRELMARLADHKAANEELESFSYAVSHDLRAPLRGIDFFSQVLAEDHAEQLDAEGQAHLQRVRREAGRATQLVNDLLTLSCATREPVRKEPVDLSALARDIADGLQRTQPDRAVEWVIAEELKAEADPRLLRNVLQNLLGNAWKYTGKQPHPRIEMGMSTGDERVFYVKDNGAGFDAAGAHRLFQAFQRLHAPTEFEGTGIGLTTVKRIVERHGGRVWAEGEPGRGATFSFTL